MNNTFVRKVAAERKILTVINALTPGARQLTGLSSSAIEAWRRKAALDNTDQIVAKLLRLAALCQRLSDRSNETFQLLDPMLIQKIDAELRELKTVASVCTTNH